MFVFLVSVAATRMSAAAAPAALGACGDSIRGAAIDLQGDARRAISACITRGVECVVGPADDRESCCTRAGVECAADLADVTAAKQRFVNVVGTRRCGTIPFADVVGLEGLGYGALTPACSALIPPSSVADLPGLTDCAGRLDVARSACAIVTREEPRGADALACMGIERAFHDVTDVDPRGCGAAPPAPQLCGPGATITVVASLDTPYAGVALHVDYPDAVSLPDSGSAESVRERVAFAAAGLTVVDIRIRTRTGSMIAWRWAWSAWTRILRRRSLP